jgi:hypothetical protein
MKPRFHSTVEREAYEREQKEADMKKLLAIVLLAGCGSDSEPTDAGVVDGDGNADDGSVDDGSVIDASPLDLIDYVAPTHVCVGGTAVIPVRLNYYPDEVTTVGAFSSNSGKATVSPLSLVFTDVTWSVWQNVTVSGVALGFTVVLLSVPNYRAVEIVLPVDC